MSRRKDPLTAESLTLPPPAVVTVRYLIVSYPNEQPSRVIEIFYEGREIKNPEAFRQAALKAIGLSHYMYEERREQGEWGASFSGFQEIILHVSETLVAGGILMALKGLDERHKRPLPPIQQERYSAPSSEKDAVRLLRNIIKQDFHERRVKLLSVKRHGGAWKLKAESAHNTYSASIRTDGRVNEVSRKPKRP